MMNGHTAIIDQIKKCDPTLCIKLWTLANTKSLTYDYEKLE